MSRTASGPEWSGDMLNRPEMVKAFAGQLRRVLSDQAGFVAAIRRDAEAMWKANPPAEYGTFEAWWRHWKTTSPFAKIQEHLEAAAKLTFELEARYRRNHHEIPEKRQAAAEARQQQALPPAAAEAPAPAPHKRRTRADEDFLAMLREGRSA